MNPKSASIIHLIKNLFGSVATLVLLLSCNADSFLGQITVDKIVNPDDVPPLISFDTIPAALDGDSEVTITYTVEDDPEGGGISTATLYYTPDADNDAYVSLGTIPKGSGSVTFCVPNKSQPKPAFKIVAMDNNGNQAEEVIGTDAPPLFTVTPRDSTDLNTLLPTATADDSDAIVNVTNPTISLDTCKVSNCGVSALKYEDHPFTIEYGITTDAADSTGVSWVSCETAVASGMTVPDLEENVAGDGGKTVNVWLRSTNKDHDGITDITAISALSSDVAITYDSTSATLNIDDLAASVRGGSSQNITFTASDPNGIASIDLYYAADGTTFSLVEASASSPYSWSVPAATDIAGARLRIEVTDGVGNVATDTTAAFNIDSTAPVVAITDMASVVRGGNASVTNAVNWTITDDANTNGIATWVLEYSTDGTTYSTVATDAATPYTWDTPAVNLTTARLRLTATDNAGNTASDETALFEIDSTAPTGSISSPSNPIRGGSDYDVTFTTADANGPVTISLEYSELGDFSDTSVLTTTNSSPYTWTLPTVDSTNSLIRLVATDSVGNAATFTSSAFNIDSTIPSLTGLSLVGSPFIKKARGQYVLNDCSDVAEVYIVDLSDPAPASESAPGWQTCTETLYNMYYNDVKVGTNNIKAYVQDSVGNVNPTAITFDFDYAPASFTVEGGPTITNPIADITIDICEEVDMTHVLFKSTAVRPGVSDTAVAGSDTGWQTCSKAVGALKSYSLAPGNNTLKAYFKYDDDFVSMNPVDVAVTYSPNLTWDDSPVKNRPDMKFTGYTCTGVTHVFFNQDAGSPPTDATPGWQACTTAAGGYTYELAGDTVGSQAVYAFFKDGTNVYPDYDTITVNYDPPTVTLFNGPNTEKVAITDPAYTSDPLALSIDDCSGIDSVFIKVDTALITLPIAGVFETSASDGANDSQACTTALNGIIDLPHFNDVEGQHFYDVFFKFTTGQFGVGSDYIIPHNLERHRVDVTYIKGDTTAPAITGAGVDTPLTITLTNGNTATPPTIASFGSRANYTLNTCNPINDIALAGTFGVTNDSNSVTTTNDQTGVLNPGDYVELNGVGPFKVSALTTSTITLVSNYSGATNGVVTGNQVFPDDQIESMILKSVAESAGAPVAPASDDPDWLPCSSGAGAFRTKSITVDGNYDIYAFFKDRNGNVTVTLPETQFITAATPSNDRTIQIDLNVPPGRDEVARPNVFLKDAPTVVTPPAQFRIEDCTGVDQVYLEPSKYPTYGLGPNATDSGWQDCSETFSVNNITYDVDLKGSYTISVWFKEPSGVVGDVPRDIAFIFDPTQGTFPTPLAMWTLDDTTRMKNRYVDGKGDAHLYIWNPTNVTSVTGKVDEGVNLSGTNSYLFTENTTALKPATSVTLSMWAYLTKAETATKGLAGSVDVANAANAGYGLKLGNSGHLQFYASGQMIEKVLDDADDALDINDGWHHIIGSSDGRYLDLYVDGQRVANTDLGSPANLTYSANCKLFVVGGSADCSAGVNSDNPKATELFDEKIDEVVVFPTYFTAQNALDHYIDSFNDFHANQDSTPPTVVQDDAGADISNSVFYGEFLQNILMTTPACNGAKYIYVDETTHPPLVDTDRWQLCSEVVGSTVQINKPQGNHEMKVWAKDEYDNISTTYLKLDTAITDTTYQEPPIIYYSFDANRISGNTIYEPYSLQHAVNNGASPVSVGLQNESLAFNRAENDYVERKYAYNAQPLNAFTISVWAKLTQNDNDPQVIVGTRDPANNHGYSIEIDSNELRFMIETSGGTRTVGVSTGTYTTGWHNIIGTYDGQNQNLYIDAATPAADSFDHGSVLPVQYTGLGSFMIGAGATRNSGARASTTFKDEIDEVFLWDSALSEATIEYFFYGQDTVPPNPVPVIAQSNSVDIPVGKFRTTNCDDVASVYVTLDDSTPIADIDGWQTCDTSTNFTIHTPLLANGANTVKVWSKDASGNVSTTAYTYPDPIVFTYSTLIPEPSSYWTLDQANIDGSTVFDVVNAKDGDAYGTLEVTGKVEESLSFNGVDDYVEVAYDASFQPNDVTLSAWIKLDTLTPANDMAIAGNFNGGGYGLYFTTGSNVEFRVQANSSTQTATYDASGWATGTWYHVVGVWDSSDGQIELHINGAIETAVAALGALSPIEYANTNSFNIGAGTTTTTGAAANTYFQGDIDEVSFFQVALNDTSIIEMDNRGDNGDKIHYDITPPEIPVTATLLYYNSLVSRANLTFTDCTDIDYVIVTKDVFPPDKNDEDWQPCNTVTGGILTKELRSTDAFGKLWTKDNFGNVSKQFEYVAVTTNYDLPVQRPIVHWTFDADHYTGDFAFDRLNNINLRRVRMVETNPACTGITWTFDDTGSSLPFPGPAGVFNTGIRTYQNVDYAFQFPDSDPDAFQSELSWLRAVHPGNVKAKPTDKLSVAAWVYLPTDGVHNNEHIVSTEVNSKGWAIRLAYDGTSGDHRVYFTVHTDKGTINPYLETQNYSTGWHLIQGVFDGSDASATLYFDGIFIKKFFAGGGAPAAITYEPNAKLHVGVKQTTGDLPDTPNPFTVTGGPSGCNKTSQTTTFFTGTIDEILIWDKVTTGLEASSLYHNGADILYAADTTPPGNPSLTLENSEPELFTDKAFFTVNDCYKGLPDEADHIAGVLVNEGTQPDKQDDRWRICRTRFGSFGLEDLTPGGHTITTWFKDRAGNVTAASSDLVVNYIDDALPQANAFWPLDNSSLVSNYQRNVIVNGDHDLLMVNYNNPGNPTATSVAGKVDEAPLLAAPSGTQGAFMTAKSSAASARLLRPVNYFSVGGWFYLDSSWGNTRYLIDKRVWQDAATRGGYSLRTAGGNLQFIVELALVGTRTLSTPLSGLSTGWNHVIGRFDGFNTSLVVNGTEVATEGPYAERDFHRYDIYTDFRIGANSENFTHPNEFLNERVDEIGLWGYDLTDTAINNIITANDGGNHSYPALTTPNAVDNAYVYFYDLIGNRARMTMLDCDNTPYVYIQARPGGGAGTSAPTGDEADWVKCRTEPGALVSAILPVGTTYVEVYAKNADGVVNAGYATREIDPVLWDYNPPLPTVYYSLNSEHSIAGRAYDFMSDTSGPELNASTKTTNDNGSAITFNANNTYVHPDNNLVYSFRNEFTHNIWAHIDNSDTGYRLLSLTDYHDSGINNREYILRMSGGQLQFYLNVNQPGNHTRGTSLPGIGYPVSRLTTGMHMITTQYDGTVMRLYVDGQLLRELDVGYRNFEAAAFRPVSFNRVTNWDLGNGTDSWNGVVDEHMIYNYELTEAQINDLYYLYKDDFNTTDDTTAPAAGRTINVTESTFGGGKWPTSDTDPVYTITDCTDIHAVFITLNNATPPDRNDAGWQYCQTDAGHFTGPTLSTVGDNTINFWYKDIYGNVTSSSQDITIDYSVATLPDPVAYWPLDSNSVIEDQAYELIAGNNGYLYNRNEESSYWTGGQTGDAFNFDGARRYIEVEHNPAFKPTEEITLSAWVFIPGGGTGRRFDYILDTRGTDATNTISEGYFWRWVCATDVDCGGLYDTPYEEDEFFEFGLSLNGSVFTLDYPSVDLGINTWRHITTTFDGRYMKLYVNKVLRRTVDTGAERSINYEGSYNTSLIMGANATVTERPSGNYFAGALDEVAIYDVALIQSQVTSLFDSYVNAGTRIYDRGVTASIPADANVTRWQPTARAYGNRYRFTVSDCGTTEMILINGDSSTAPAANSLDWQECNTIDGGILSAPMADTGSPVTFVVWGKTYDGTSVTSVGSSGTANSETYTETFAGTIPRSRVHWSLDQLSSNAINGTQVFDLINRTDGSRPLTADPTSAAAVMDNGFDFNGGEYLTFKPTPSSNPFYKFSISAWAELTKGDTFHRHIVGNHQDFGNAQGKGVGLRVYGGDLQFYVTARNDSGGAAFYTVSIDSNLYTTGFHHIVGTYDGRALVLYLDGVEVSRYNIPFYGSEVYQTLHDDYSHWTIGAETDGKNGAAAGSYFSGAIDEVRIFNETLTALEVYRLYDYGSYFLPSTDGTFDPPTDPGIALSDGQTSTNLPWAKFTMPTCVAANGEQIDAVFVNTSADPAPSNADTGWQYCTTDDGYIESPILARGTTTVRVYFRDEEGEISSATDFNVTYIEPDMPKPQAYYTFDSSDRLSHEYTLDMAGEINIRRPYNADNDQSYGTPSPNITEQAWYPTFGDYTQTAIEEFVSPTGNYTISFWYFADNAPTYHGEIYRDPSIFVKRNTSDRLEITHNVWPLDQTYTSPRLTPNAWTHVTIRRKGNSAKIYFNGREVDSRVLSFNYKPKTAQPLVIGHLTAGNTTENYMDEFAIYHEGLTDEQIAFLYFAGANNENLQVAEANIVPVGIPDNYWNFDDANLTGNVLSDIRGSQDFTIRDAVTTGEAVNTKYGQSFNFSRFEKWLAGGDPPESTVNTTGTKQYIETDGTTPFALGTNFSVSAWVKRKNGNEWAGDKSAIFDQWGPDAANQSFTMYYDRGAGVFTMTIRINANNYTVTAPWDNFEASTAWAHVQFVRRGAWLHIFVNGNLSGSSYIAQAANQTDPVNLPTTIPIRTRVGESSLWPFYYEDGTVSITSGTDTVVGVGTDFENTLLRNKTGTVDIVGGTSAVVGTGTAFTTELAVGDYIKINGEFHEIATITDDENLDLVTNHVAGATTATFQMIQRGRIRINGQDRHVIAIADATNLTVDSNWSTTAAGTVWQRNITGNDWNGDDEWGLNMFVDELAVWTGETRSIGQARDFFNLNNTQAVLLEPRIALEGFGGNNSVPTRADLTLSDCGDYTHVWVGYDGDATPLESDGPPNANYNGWVACSTASQAIQSAELSAGNNDLRVWFKTGTTVSSYTTTISINQATGDITPPTLPTVTMETVGPTSLSFARFSLDSCSTSEIITGVLVQMDGTDPSANDSRWQSCTTVNSAFLSPPLVPGTNTISFYFKDATGNVTAKDNHTIDHNKPAIPTPSAHLTMGDGTYANGYLKETTQRGFLAGANTGNMVFASSGIVGEAIDFSSNAYFQGADHNLALTNQVTAAAWINISQPSSYAHIVGQWGNDQTTDKWAMRVDSTGRLCFDFQTVNTTTTFNTDEYKRSCSTGRVPFAEWVHVAVTRNAATVNFYIDNKLAGTDSIDTGDFQATTLIYRVGAQEAGATYPTNGLLDEVSVWTSALTDIEREGAYALGRRGISVYGDRLPQAMPIADHYWDYDDANYSDPTLSAVLGAIDLDDVPSITPSSVTSGGTGQVGESFNFANENELVASANSLALGTNFTLSTWARINATDGPDEMILSKWNTGDTNQQEFRLYTTGTTLKFDYNTTTADTYPDVGYNTLTGPALSTATWYHLTVTRDNDQLKLYINGQLRARTTMGTDPLEDVALPLRIGAENAAGNNLDGDMDETLIVKSTLDANQVKYLYDKGAANSAAPTAIEVSVAEPSTTVEGATARFTIGDCGGHANYTITNSAVAPPNGSVSTPCTEAVGGAVYNSLTSGGNTLYFYFGDGVTAPTSGPSLSVTRSD